MKPNSVLLAIIGILSFALAKGQEWVGTQFILNEEKVIPTNELPSDLSHLKCSVSEGTFFYTDMKSFQRTENDHAATIYAIKLGNSESYQIILPLPITVKSQENASGKCWITDFSIHPEFAVVSIQNSILIYKRLSEKEFEFDTVYEHTNIKATYIFNDTLHYFEEEHDHGYKWFHRPLHGGKEELVRELRYEVPHLVQVNPNRYLFHDQKNVFFLSTRYPVLHKYSLDGKWIDDIVFDLPDWHPFEDEYIEKSLSVPYGIERIHATMNDVWKYSYPKYVFPIGGDYLLYYTQYDTTTGKARLQYALSDASGKSHLFSKKDTCQKAYTGYRFPLNIFDVNADKAHISWNDLLIEICADGGVDWADLLPTEYKRQQENYFKQNDPKVTIRTMRYKNTQPERCARLFDRDKHLLSLYELPEGKHIFLVNQALECSACRNALLQLLNTTDTNRIQIGILYDFIPGALLEREMMKEIRQILERTFKFFYLADGKRIHDPRYIQLHFNGYDNFPGILLYETGRAPIFFSSSDIFDDNIQDFQFKESFVKYWNSFVQEHTIDSGDSY